MEFDAIPFIKAHATFDPNCRSYAPLFRRSFCVEEEIRSAKLYVCGLGYGYFYLNGSPVSSDLFTSPVSDYQKTVWYMTYDVAHLLQQGDNLFAAECGNGWYNEAMPTTWDQRDYGVRDVPKLKMLLLINGKVAVTSDSSFRCSATSAVTYNQLRTGEVFDGRLYDAAWTTADFDDSSWSFALPDDTPPRGVLRECTCEPIRECQELSPVSITRLPDGCHLFDFGVNMSGYVRLRVRQPEGDTITLRYGEDADEHGCVEQPVFQSWYPEDPFQTDTFICGREALDRRPRFTYHGFRYVHATGLKTPTKDTLTAYFVHQDIPRRTTFRCSNENLNRLFEAGVRATYSNLFYMPTDCPTREKYGWCNDAQASTDQFLTDFKSEKLLAKFWQDVCDAMNEEGMLPGVVPPYHRAYEWGNGPVSEGILYEIPYRVYLHTGDASLLVRGIPFFERSLGLWKRMIDAKGVIDYGLWDWEPPRREVYVDHTVVNDLLFVKCLRVYRLALALGGMNTARADGDVAYHQRRVKEKYIGADGRCTVNKQTAVAMLIDLALYDDLAPLAAQLKTLIEENDMNHDCGMVGIRYLYPALNRIGLQEYGYRILTAKGYPSYLAWLEDGATTLYEMWNVKDEKISKNHHMFSGFMPWLIQTAAGINQAPDSVGYARVEISPYFFRDLDFAEAEADTAAGPIRVHWQRKDGAVELEITLPEGMQGTYGDAALHTGANHFTVKG